MEVAVAELRFESGIMSGEILALRMKMSGSMKRNAGAV